MLVFSAFTPNTPLLHPSVGGPHLDSLPKTHAAMTRLAEELYASHPDCLVHLSLGAEGYEEPIRVNYAPSYGVSFADFSQSVSRGRFQSHPAVISGVQRDFRAQKHPITLDSNHLLPHSSGIPLLRLLENHDLPIVPITLSGVDTDQQLRIGRGLAETLQASTARIALFASADLGRPSLFTTAARHAVHEKNPRHLLSLEEGHLEDQYALEPLLVLLGALEQAQVRPELLSYEQPFGIGYLTAQFHHA